CSFHPHRERYSCPRDAGQTQAKLSLFPTFIIESALNAKSRRKNGSRQPDRDPARPDADHLTAPGHISAARDELDLVQRPDGDLARCISPRTAACVHLVDWFDGCLFPASSPEQYRLLADQGSV